MVLYWGGVPARLIESINEYNKKIQGKTVPLYGKDCKTKNEYLKLHCPELFKDFD